MLGDNLINDSVMVTTLLVMVIINILEEDEVHPKSTFPPTKV